AGWEEEGGNGYVRASAEAVAVGASAPDDPAELFLNGLPHCEQNGAARSSSEPHCWHRSICNGSHNAFDMLPRLRALKLSQSGEFREYPAYRQDGVSAYSGAIPRTPPRSRFGVALFFSLTKDLHGRRLLGSQAEKGFNLEG